MLGTKENRLGREQEWVDTDGESGGAQSQSSRLSGVSMACRCPRERHRLSTSSKAQGMGGISRCTAKEVPRYIFLELPQYEQDSGRCRTEVGDRGRSWKLPGLSDLGPEVGSSPDIDGVEEAGQSLLLV